MKESLLSIIDEYLFLFPEEKERQKKFLQNLMEQDYEEIIDWNNFIGHVVAGAFVYAKEEKRFLFLYHKDLKMFLYPGGHIDVNDRNILETAKRELLEETGLSNLKSLILSNNPLIPIDIDTHIIPYNDRLNLPEHNHFEFRYLFIIEHIIDIEIDENEIGAYRWIDIEDIAQDKNFGSIASKLEKLLKAAGYE